MSSSAPTGSAHCCARRTLGTFGFSRPPLKFDRCGRTSSGTLVTPGRAGRGSSTWPAQTGRRQRRAVREQFDRRVVPDAVREFVRACQAAAPCHLGGGAALSGAWLGHRLSRDIDLFVHDRAAHRDLVEDVGRIAESLSMSLAIVRDSGGHVRGRLEFREGALEVDLVHEKGRRHRPWSARVAPPSVSRDAASSDALAAHRRRAEGLSGRAGQPIETALTREVIAGGSAHRGGIIAGHEGRFRERFAAFGIKLSSLSRIRRLNSRSSRSPSRGLV
jgi:hypothetical protein